MLCVGIDPGISGGLALLERRNGAIECVDLADMPTVLIGKKREIDAGTIVEIMRDWSPEKAILEAVHAMPKQGVSSTFAFGRGVGIVVGVLSTLRIPFVEIRPQEWQKAVLRGCPGEGKDKCLKWAWSMFPDAELKTARGRLLDGRADALGLAYFGLVA